ncbi:hypothetical protein HK096_008640, partial [Nowakowskiella sp. JEL0078]
SGIEDDDENEEPLSRMLLDLLQNISNKVNVERSRIQSLKIPGWGWTVRGDISAKVMAASGKCSSYELSRDSVEFAIDVIVILLHIQKIVETTSGAKKRKSTTDQISSTKKSRKPNFLERQEETFEYIRNRIGSSSAASSTKSAKDLANRKRFLLNKRLGEGLPASLYCKAFRDFKGD